MGVCVNLFFADVLISKLLGDTEFGLCHFDALNLINYNSHEIFLR